MELRHDNTGLQWALKAVTAVFIGRPYEDTQKEEGHGGRQETPRSLETTRSWERGEEGASPEPSERVFLCQHVDFKLQASGTGKEYISVVLYSLPPSL